MANTLILTREGRTEIGGAYQLRLLVGCTFHQPVAIAQAWVGAYNEY